MADEKSGDEWQSSRWGMFWGGDWRFGDYGVSVDGAGKARLTLLSTANKPDSNGAGVIEARYGLYDRDAANRIRLALCDPANQTGRGLDVRPTDSSPATFWAFCEINGKIQERRGYIGMLPENLFKETGGGIKILQENLLSHGTRRIWINASVVNIERRKNCFLVTIRMINSGRDVISFKRPDLWSGKHWEETMAIGAINTNSKGDGGWGFELAGKPLANQAEFDGEYVTLQGGAHRDFVFEAWPDDAYKAGTYAFSLDAWLYLDWKDGEEKQRSHVDFYSGTARRTVITIDRDYPSTPEERGQWEARHRADLMFRPVKPGETFLEPGLYRAVQMIAGSDYRSLQVRPFKAGDVATTENVRMPMQSEYGGHLNGQVKWVWEGSAPTPVEQFSFDMIPGTERFCDPGAACPRSGRWLARLYTGMGWSERDYWYDLANIVTRRQGESMPPLSGNGQWEWLGAT